MSPITIHVVRDPLETEPGDFTPALRAGDLVTISSQGSCDPYGHPVPGTVGEQTRRTLDNVQRLLRAAGSDLGRVVKVSCYLRNLERDFDEFNGAYKAHFKAAGATLPCRTTIGAQLFAGYDVVMDVIALADNPAPRTMEATP